MGEREAGGGGRESGQARLVIGSGGGATGNSGAAGWCEGEGAEVMGSLILEEGTKEKREL